MDLYKAKITVEGDCIDLCGGMCRNFKAYKKYNSKVDNLDRQPEWGEVPTENRGEPMSGSLDDIG